jgi:hypothetical protein
MPIDPKSIGLPLSARPTGDPRKLDGVAGAETLHGLFDDAKSLYDVSMQEAGGKPLLKAEMPTVGSQVFDGAKSAMDYVKKFDPQNIAGTVPHSLGMMNQLQVSMGAGQIMNGILGPKLGSLMKLLPVLQQLGNMDLLSQAQSLIGQEFASLPLPQIPQIPNLDQIVTPFSNGLPDVSQVTGQLTGGLPDLNQITGQLTAGLPNVGQIAGPLTGGLPSVNQITGQLTGELQRIAEIPSKVTNISSKITEIV